MNISASVSLNLISKVDMPSLLLDAMNHTNASLEKAPRDGVDTKKKGSLEPVLEAGHSKQ